MSYQSLPNTLLAGANVIQFPSSGSANVGALTQTLDTAGSAVPALQILAVNYIVVTGGSGSYNLSPTVSTNVLLPTGAGQTAIINFPPLPVDGQTTSFSIIGFTVSLSLGLPGAPLVQPTYAVGAVAGTSFYYIFRSADATWYRYSN